jgi:sortase A
VPPDDAPSPNVVLGRIEIPKIGLDRPLGEGITPPAIDRGPTHWPGTARPGQYGNVVVAGHRTTAGGPFRHIDSLGAGDVMLLTSGDGRFAYRVTESFVVDDSEVWVADSTNACTLTLFSCHPVGSAAQRIVVRGELVTG